MKAVKRWKYYCEFCKKSGGNKGIMVAHERSCTNNPNRACGVCSKLLKEPQPDLARMLDTVNQYKGKIFEVILDDDSIEFLWGREDCEKEVLEKLRDITDCPACILSALRQSGVPFLFPSFKFKEELGEIWAQIRYDEFEWVHGYY